MQTFSENSFNNRNSVVIDLDQAERSASLFRTLFSH